MSLLLPTYRQNQGATNITCRNKSGTLALLGDLEDVNNILLVPLFRGH